MGSGSESKENNPTLLRTHSIPREPRCVPFYSIYKDSAFLLFVISSEGLNIFSF